MRNRDIIKQYVNTGNAIKQTQIYKLNDSLRKSYFRKRFIAAKGEYAFENNHIITSYEYHFLSTDEKNYIFPFIDIKVLDKMYNKDDREKYIKRYLNVKKEEVGENNYGLMYTSSTLMCFGENYIDEKTDKLIIERVISVQMDSSLYDFFKVLSKDYLRLR